MVHAERGHRVVPHTADVILEAWGSDLASCCEQAVAALAGVYLDSTGGEVVERRRLHVAPGPPESQLLDLLEEVIFALDTAEGVPVGAEVSLAPDRGLDVELVLADRATVVPAGAVPKAVSRSELMVNARQNDARCRFLVDV